MSTLGGCLRKPGALRTPALRYMTRSEHTHCANPIDFSVDFSVEGEGRFLARSDGRSSRSR